MAIPKEILAIDIGGGTQDILVYEDGKPIENCVQLILPSPTQIVAQKIARATALGRDIFLTGNTMGGGPCHRALGKHLQAGLKVHATELAALTFRDNLDEVRKEGIRITNRASGGFQTIRLGDVDLPSLEKALRLFQIKLPRSYAVAVQDHGFNPRGSNRRLRFQYWRKFLRSGGRLRDLIYFDPPDYMTRMLAVQKDAPGAAVMDTCAAAIWGALCDPVIAGRLDEGLAVVNLGNQHTLGALIQRERIWGVFEHHTRKMTREKLKSMVDHLLLKRLSNDEVFRDGGHGCAVDPGFSRKRGYRFTAVTGPRRGMADGLGYYPAVPYGDMMLAGCFGLVAALKAVLGAES